jgi:hypothetical protein
MPAGGETGAHWPLCTDAHVCEVALSSHREGVSYDQAATIKPARQVRLDVRE